MCIRDSAYATRIVKLKDGEIRADSDAFTVEERLLEAPEHKNMGKAAMSFLTALSLSFHNLRTKKARTLLTSFAGSIGIIGIALILALSTGVNNYIQSVEEETLSEYPLQIQSTGFDLTTMMTGGEGQGAAAKPDDEEVHVIQMVTDMFSTMDSNDLESLKQYLDSEESGIENYTNAVEYSYNIMPQIYRQDGGEIRQVNPDKTFSALGLGSSTSSNSLMSSMMSTDVFYEMPENESLYKEQYDVKAGRWPKNYNECVLVLTSGGSISDFMLYTMGLRDVEELQDMIEQFLAEENIDVPEDMGTYSYEDIVGITFKLVNSADYYAYDSQYKVWKDKADNKEYMKRLVENGEDLTIVGVVQPSEAVSYTHLGGSQGWAWKLMSDLYLEEALSGTVRLYDIDRDAAKANEKIGNRMFSCEEAKGKWNFLTADTLEEGLRGADFVIISILPATFEEMRSDVHTPEKYGIWQSVGDTVGPGGIFRALRTIPMYEVIAAGIKKCCPDAWVINYTNPMALCTGALYKAFPEIKACLLYTSSIFWNIWRKNVER